MRLPRRRIRVTSLVTYPEVWRDALARRKSLSEDADKGNLDKVFELIDDLAKKYPIAPDRVYVLGHSMEGFGSWTAIASAPDRFAAHPQRRRHEALVRRLHHRGCPDLVFPRR